MICISEWCNIARAPQRKFICSLTCCSSNSTTPNVTCTFAMAIIMCTLAILTEKIALEKFGS